jgi:hypothetical protein
MRIDLRVLNPFNPVAQVDFWLILKEFYGFAP